MSKESDYVNPVKETLNSPEVQAYFSRSIISPFWRDDLDDVVLILHALSLFFLVEMLIISGGIGLWTILIPSLFKR